MAASQSNEQLVFNYRTLRLIIGSLAFAFPTMVIALTGKVTTSISASYYEPPARNFFVGFLFILGALLVSYKGHPLDTTGGIPGNFLRRIRRYPEDWVSSAGGIAAILTALFPTACDGCSMDAKAYIHTIGAFTMFASVVYFCLVAFPRSVNRKLANQNSDFKELEPPVRKVRYIWEARTAAEAGYCVCPEIVTFLNIASRVRMDYSKHEAVPKSGAPNVPGKPGKMHYTLLAYKRTIARGYVYLLCGLAIFVTLLSFIVMMAALPAFVQNSKTTFIIETISLILFGTAWMTASRLPYLRKIHLLRVLRRAEKKPVVVPTQAA